MMTDQELATERKRAEALRDICQVRGYTDGHTAMKAVADAITAEQVARQRATN